ncbi:MAG: exodeoxyribonuclease III [Aphanothece sp. CMT-3BRIN-NPC111]|nr:exodeoxyribonuclease III [Aphanothece sp. CMT-3BRIN-NPC111]
MKIATWNVNSIRSRLEQVVQWLQENSVDVLCLQETKVVDADFPRSLFEQLGYHLYISGQKSYNGVAIISRSPLADVSTGFAPVLGDNNIGELDEQKRVITGVLDGIRIVNLYVPNGAAVDSEKYYYKLRWLKVLRDYLQTLLQQPAEVALNPKASSAAVQSAIQNPKSLCVCGDFNIALEDRDIHDPAAFKGRIMASEAERQALRLVLELGLADAFRKFTAEGGHYSWWDYRTGAFRGNRGWRIDHHYLTPDLYERAISCKIDSAPRKLPKPSDHTPVIVEF